VRKSLNCAFSGGLKSLQTVGCLLNCKSLGLRSDYSTSKSLRNTSAKKVLALRASDSKTGSRLKMHRRTLAVIPAKQQNNVDKRDFLGIRSWETPVISNRYDGVFVRLTESQKRLTRR